MGSAILRFLRVVVAQGLAAAPDLINWIAGTALPVIPAPWNIYVGALLNALGKAARDRNSKWSWSPI
jgi:hypothetical protein